MYYTCTSPLITQNQSPRRVAPRSDISVFLWIFQYFLEHHFCTSGRSTHRRCSVKKDCLRNFAKLTGKRLCQSLFFNKVAGLRPSTLLEKRLWHKCFSVNFANFLRTPFLQNTSGRILMKNSSQIFKTLTLSKSFVSKKGTEKH